MGAPRWSRTRLRLGLTLAGGIAVLALGGVAACGSGGRAGSAATTVTTPIRVAPTEVPTTTTTAPPPATTVPAPSGLREPTGPGDTGAQVEALQARLYDLGYFLEARSGSYDASTSHAVMAFQKVHGLARDGVAGPDTVAALAVASKVAPTQGADRHLEISLADQVLVVVDGQGGAVAVDATTGKASTPTPPGTFSIVRQVNGWDPGPYGSLYRPKYFNGGIAVHGGVPVVATPASHGCVRVPDPAIDWLWAAGLAPIGTRVVVY